ncbi:MAG: type II secretion system F family protein [Chloroflexi bacterium]|nr:type II secretion system F family protein [Chloroflexota bacterium]MCY4110413.1 type II secretion system F family protein [Chloroflexota bacterium]
MNLAVVAAGFAAAGVVVFALALMPVRQPSDSPMHGWVQRRLGRLADQLHEGGVAMTPPIFLVINGGVLVVGAVIGGLVAPPLVPVGAIVGAIAPWVVLRTAVVRARARADREALVLLRLLGAHLRAGATYMEALRAAAEGVATPQVRDDLAWVANRFRLDRPLHGSLAAVAARTPGRHLRLAYRVLARAIEHGVAGRRAVTALEGLEATVAANLRAHEDLRAKTRGLRIQIVVVAVAIPVIHLYLRGTNPESFTVMDEPLGQFVLLPGAVMCELLGLYLWRRFTRAQA